MNAWLICVATVVSFVLPLHGSPYRVTPEVAVSEIIAGPTYTVGFRASASFDGTQYVVFWEDVRGLRREIYASRVTRSGEVLDPLGIPIGIAGASIVGPKAVWTGARHLVLATSDDPFERPTAYLMSLASDGSVIHGPRKLGDRGSALDLTMVGDRVLTVRARETEVFVDVLDATGEVIEAEATDLEGFHFTAIAGSGHRALAVSRTENAFVGVLLDRDGNIVGPALQISADAPHVEFDVASSGREFLVVWRQGTEVVARRVSSGGAMSDTFSIGEASLDYNRLTATWAGDRYVVTSDRRDKSEIIEVYESSVIRSEITPSPHIGTTTVVAGDGEVVGVWYREDHRGRNVFAKRLGTDDPEVLISRAAARQMNPDLRAVSGGVEVIWIETRNPASAASILSTVVSGSHAATPREIVTSAPDQTLGAARIAATSRAALVVWRDVRVVEFRTQYAIRARALVDSSRRDVEIASSDADNGEPEVIAGDDAFLITWPEQFKGIRAVVVGENAARVGGIDITVPPPSSHLIQQVVSRPKGAWDGERFLLVWSVQQRSLGWVNSEIFGVFLQPDGTASEPFTIARDGRVDPAVASNGAHFLVTWTAASADGNHLAIEAARVSAAADITGPTVIAAGVGKISSPEIVWTGREYFLSWIEGELEQQALRGAAITAAGGSRGVVDIAQHPLGIRSHALTAANGGHVGVAYARPMEEAGVVHRVFVRAVEISAPPSRRRSAGR